MKQCRQNETRLINNLNLLHEVLKGQEIIF